MNRWRLEVEYLDRPARVYEFEDLHALGVFQRTHSPRAWRMGIPERLYGPAMSREEFEDGLRVERRGREWALVETVR